MSVKNNLFSPEKISIVEFKILKGQIDRPEIFDSSKVEDYHLDNTLQLGFNIEAKLVKADITINIKTESEGQSQEESTGAFHFIFIYNVENLEELTKPLKNNLIELDPDLGNALSAITYSTSRGILLTRLQGTALQNFILPVINPNQLLYTK